MPRLVSGKCYCGNDALVPDAALTRKSLENSRCRKRPFHWSLRFQTTRCRVLTLPLYKSAVYSFEEIFHQHTDAKCASAKAAVASAAFGAFASFM
jgi:hypothetical protein